ncbi:MAG: flagellar basal body-associated FliL family protein [Sarcina sp.]
MGTNKDENKEKKSITTGKIILIGGIFLLITFAGTFTGFYFLTQQNKGAQAAEEEKPKAKAEEIKIFDLGDDFVVNLSTEGKSKYVKARIVLSYDAKNKAFTSDMEKNTAILRDATITYLKGRTEEQLANLDTLKSELVVDLNKKLNQEDPIKEVYFQSLLIQ